VRTDIFLSSIFLSWLSDESIKVRQAACPYEEGEAGISMARKWKSSGSAFSYHQFSCLKFLAQYTTTNTAT